ncbi:hypothetical protein [Arthrobacter sp. 260]|uniref:hypothetical protein n=1 Tax=Arthrobacter sp. 260 TaxID=2735314 RepID=UPI001492CB6E|nr:hypothetical protein [Arthrobacter sp. 260]NOJ61364.1 hypothetical protein [Arthrobacter sp. 260]
MNTEPHKNGAPSTADHSPTPHQRSEALKERVYVTFTALAVVIATERDAVHLSVGRAVVALLLTVLGTLMAVFVADLIAHMVRESSLPTRGELRHLMHVSFGSLSVIATPLAILGLSALQVIDLGPALRLISISLIVTLVVVTLAAVRRLNVSRWSKLKVLAIMTALGLAVLTIELAVH